MNDDEFDSDEDEEDEDENEDVNLFRGVIVFYSCSDESINISSLEHLVVLRLSFFYLTLYCRCYL